MEGVDKEKVQRVVYEMSKGSKYFEHEEKKEAYMKQKIESFRAQLAKLSDSDLSHHRKVWISHRWKNDEELKWVVIMCGVGVSYYYACLKKL